jgi:monofunctional biosynthetic peptidoglycan transglycosylase
MSSLGSIGLLLGLVAMGVAVAVSAAAQQATPDVRLLTDFTSATQDFGWYVVNDNVMGGRSRGGFKPESGDLFFAGSTDTNGGGFSSIRTRDLRLDLSAFAGLRVHVKADGRRYTWRLTTDARSRGRVVSYWADFKTVRGEWRDVAIPFSSFRPTFRGSDLDGPALDPSRIQGMGLMIYDGLDGLFELRIDRVAAYARDVRGR